MQFSLSGRLGIDIEHEPSELTHLFIATKRSNIHWFQPELFSCFGGSAVRRFSRCRRTITHWSGPELFNTNLFRPRGKKKQKNVSKSGAPGSCDVQRQHEHGEKENKPCESLLQGCYTHCRGCTFLHEAIVGLMAGIFSARKEEILVAFIVSQALHSSKLPFSLRMR